MTDGFLGVVFAYQPIFSLASLRSSMMVPAIPLSLIPSVGACVYNGNARTLTSPGHPTTNTINRIVIRLSFFSFQKFLFGTL